MIKSGNKDVETAVKNVCFKIAVMIFQLQVVIDPETVVIGGGISEEPLFIEYIQKAVHDIYSKNTDIPCEPHVVACKYHNEANLLGALYNYRKQFIKL